MYAFFSLKECRSMSAYTTVRNATLPTPTTHFSQLFHTSDGCRPMNFLQWYSIIMVFIFPVGIPLTYLAALYRGRTKINPDPRNPKHGAVVREDDPTIQKTK